MPAVEFSYGQWAANKYPTMDVYGEGEYPVLSRCWATWQLHLRDAPGSAWYLKAKWDSEGCGPACQHKANSHVQWRKLMP